MAAMLLLNQTTEHNGQDLFQIHFHIHTAIRFYWIVAVVDWYFRQRFVTVRERFLEFGIESVEMEGRR